MSDLSKRLESLREMNGWSKSYVEKRIGTSPQRYANWEYGISEPDLDMLTQIAKSYQVSTDYLLGVSNETPEPTKEEIKKVDLAKEPVILAYDGEVASKEETDTVKNILKLIKSHGKN